MDRGAIAAGSGFFTRPKNFVQRKATQTRGRQKVCPRKATQTRGRRSAVLYRACDTRRARQIWPRVVAKGFALA
eukprot:5269404-Pyramimonas_sp.AAC.1